MDDQAVKRYAETRLFGKNVDPKEVKAIQLHNGVLPKTLESMVHAIAGPEFIKVAQDNGREPLFFHSNGTLFIPQYSGFGRRKRYEEMIRAYQRVIDRKLEFYSLDVEGDPRKTNINYSNFAYDFVKGLLLSGDLAKINAIILGPAEAVVPHAQRIEKKQEEYLDATLLHLKDQVILNVGYVYADQAGTLLDKMMREFEAIARKSEKKRQLQVLMFGRFGGLLKHQKRHDLIYPIGSLEEMDIADGKHLIYPLHNILASDQTSPCINLNVASVMNETVEQLDRARRAGCSSVDMETRDILESVYRARRHYSHVLTITFGCVGYISDLPLQVPSGERDTLAKELDSEQGKMEAGAMIMEYLKS